MGPVSDLFASSKVLVATSPSLPFSILYSMIRSFSALFMAELNIHPVTVKINTNIYGAEEFRNTFGIPAASAVTWDTSCKNDVAVMKITDQNGKYYSLNL